MFYAAYGILVNNEKMYEICPDVSLIGSGRINGYEFTFNTEADIVETENEYDFVPVVVWDVADNDMKRLTKQMKSHGYFERKNFDIEMDNDGIVQAFTFVVPDDEKAINPPDRHYFDAIMRGCIENDIDIMYLYDALDYAYGSKDR